MKVFKLLAVNVLFLIPACLCADSHAYVVASGISFDTPGSITPFNIAKGELGAAFFAPIGGYIIGVPHGTGQIWQAVADPDCICDGPWAINVLDAKSGGTLGSIALTYSAYAMIFDAAGQYAYVSLFNGDLLRIAVASRTIVQTVSLGAYNYGPMVLSSDGSQLFLATSKILVLNPQSFKIGATIPDTGAMFVFGTTLLVSSGTQMTYFDTVTLQQTNSAVVPANSSIFGVSPDGSKIYIYSSCGCGSPDTMEIVDFSSGQILVTQAFSEVDLTSVFLSPDGSEIVVASSAVLLVDPNTLATIKAIWAVGIPNSAAYLDSNTLLMLNTNTGAMMVVDQASAQVTATFPLGLSPLSGEVADPQRGLVYVGGYYYEDGTPNVVSTKLNRIVANLGIYGGFAPAAVAGDQLYGVVNGGTDVYNLATGTYPYLSAPVTVHHGQYLFTGPGVAPPDGKTYWEPFAVDNSNGGALGGGVAVYATATNILAGKISLPLTYGPSVFSPDSTLVYIAGPQVIAVYNTSTLQKTATFDYTTTFTALCISPDGSLLYATDGSAIYVLDAATGAQQRTFALPAAVAGVMAISPDGTALFLAESDEKKVVDMVDTASGQVTPVPVPYPPSSIVVMP